MNVPINRSMFCDARLPVAKMMNSLPRIVKAMAAMNMASAVVLPNWRGVVTTTNGCSFFMPCRARILRLLAAKLLP